ncbi:MAG: hypothetical protein AB7D37_19465 [Desulfovibrio sp.]
MAITKESIVTTLHDAYEEADEAYYYATNNNAPTGTLQTLKDAKQHAFLAYIRASKQALVHVTATTEAKVKELRETTEQLKADLKALKQVSEIVKTVAQILALIGIILTAFA